MDQLLDLLVILRSHALAIVGSWQNKEFRTILVFWQRDLNAQHPEGTIEEDAIQFYRSTWNNALVVDCEHSRTAR